MSSFHNIAVQLLAAGRADSPALLGPADAVVTYGELRSRVEAVSAWVAAQGGQPGDRIPLCAENGAFFVTAYLGIIHAGRVVVPLNTDWSVRTIASVAETAGANVVLASRRQTGRMLKSAGDFPVRELRCRGPRLR